MLSLRTVVARFAAASPATNGRRRRFVCPTKPSSYRAERRRPAEVALEALRAPAAVGAKAQHRQRFAALSQSVSQSVTVSHPVGRAGGRPLPCHRVSLVCVKRLLLLLLPLLLAKAIKKRTVRSGGGGGGGGSQMVTQFSRNIRAKISTAARPHARSPPRPLTRCHRPKKRLLASAATAAAAAEAEVGSLGRRRRRRRRAGTPSMTICWLQAPIVNSH